MRKLGNRSRALNIKTARWSKDHTQKECAVTGVRVGGCRGDGRGLERVMVSEGILIALNLKQAPSETKHKTTFLG